MTVLVVSEGRNELGGALQTLVQRLSAIELQIDHEPVSHARLHAFHGKGRGYFKRAVRWMLTAQNRGYDAMVLEIDQDGKPERTKELSAAQDFTGASISRALGVAIKTFDAWMLVDEKALTAVLGCNVPRQRNPETISDPKRNCDELLETSGAEMGRSEMYAAVATALAMDLLESRCPKGFAPFAVRVREM